MKSYPLLRQDIFAWCLAVVLPLLWVVLYLSFPQNMALVIYLVVALVWVLLDRTNLMKQGITPPSWLWFPFYFVYLRQRDQSQGKPWRLLQVWCSAPRCHSWRYISSVNSQVRKIWRRVPVAW